MARKITPHKGGRSESYLLRCTPEDKELLSSLAQAHGVTMSDIISVSVQSLQDEFNAVERHLLVHGIKTSDYQREREGESSYTLIVFGDDAKIEQWYDGDSSKYKNSYGWSNKEISDFFSGMLFEEILDDLFTEGHRNEVKKEDG